MKTSRIVLGCILALLGFLAGGACAQVITEFSAGITAGAGLGGIAGGPDGNLWFTETNIDRIGRITPQGVVTEFGAGITAGSRPFDITAGPDGNLWFTEIIGNRIGRITPQGVVTEFSAGITFGPWDIATGPDGNLWFTEYAGHRIGRITPAGVVTEFSAGITGSPNRVTTGPDGNLWFTESGGKIGRITPHGVVTEFSAGSTALASWTWGFGSITAGPDGNLWFTETLQCLFYYHALCGSRIGRITPLGVVTHFSTVAGYGITAGPDGSLWFTEYYGIGRRTPQGVITTFSVGMTAGAQPRGIAAGPDGNLWFVESTGNRIGRITACLSEAACSPSATTVVSSVNPAPSGQAIVFTASVAGNFPTGTVQFMDGATSLGSPVTLSGGGVAQLMTSTLTLGTHAITAVYDGDNNNAPSASSVLVQNVKKGHHKGNK